MDYQLIKHIEKLIQKLQSTNANTRYEACEYLRVAPEITPEAIKALQQALNDSNTDVVEAAKAALKMHSQPAISQKKENKSDVLQDVPGMGEDIKFLRNIAQPVPDKNSNGVASVLRVISILTYIGGFFYGIVLGFVTAGYGSTGFSFITALIYWIAAFISGTIFLGFSEIINLLQQIVDK